MTGSTHPRATGILKITGVVLVCAAIAVALLSPAVREALDPRTLPQRIEAFGAMAPLAYVAIFVVTSFLFIPPTAMVMAGGAMFGQVWGFLLGLFAVNLNGILGFALARVLGKDFVDRMVSQRFYTMQQRIEKSGFSVVLYLRLMFVPFWLVTYTAGLSSIRISSFAAATLIGTLPAIFATAFLGDRLRLIIANRDLGALSDPMSLLAATLFIIAVFVPTLINRFRNGIPAEKD